MSFGFDMNPETEDQILASGKTVKIPKDEVDMLDNFGDAFARGLPQGLASMGKASSVLLGAFPAAYDSLKVNLYNAGLYEYKEGERLATDVYFEKVAEPTKEAIKYWAPDASQTGTAGMVANQLVSTLTQASMGGIGLATSLGVNESTNLVEQGVDSDTALKAGAVTAATTYAGFKLPFFGKNLLQKVSFGAGSNVALGAGTDLAINQILESGGYSEQAKNYDAFNAQSRMIDALTGAAFGGVAHIMTRGQTKEIKETDLTPEEKDAIFTANNAKHFQEGSAPGVPVDIRSSKAHKDALSTALDQLSRGEPVDVSNVKNIDSAGFRPTSRETLTAEDVGLNVVDEAPNDPLYDAIESREYVVPEADEARALMDTFGDLMVNLQDGDNIRSVRAADLMKELEAETKSIETEGKAFDAAITCYLGG